MKMSCVVGTDFAMSVRLREKRKKEVIIKELEESIKKYVN